MKLFSVYFNLFVLNLNYKRVHPRSRSLEPEEEEDLCPGLGADVFVLALGHALGPGPVLDGLGVGQLGRAQQRLEVLGLHGLDLLQVGGGLELP